MVSGLLNATFGNAVELILSCVALSKGLVRLVQVTVQLLCLGDAPFQLSIGIFVGLNPLEHASCVGDGFLCRWCDALGTVVQQKGCQGVC